MIMTNSHSSRSAETSKYSRECCYDIIHTCYDSISSWITGVNMRIRSSFLISQFNDLCEITPLTLIISAIIMVQLQRSQEDPGSLPNHVPDLSLVSGRYGPGSYYAWLLNALITTVQTGSTSPEAQSYTSVATLGTATYAVAAATDQFMRSLGVISYSQPILDASDRVNQVGWVIATFYLLHRFFKEPYTTPQSAIPNWSTATWMLAWLSHTIALIAYNIYRGDLGSRLLKCGIPLIVGIPIPLATVYILKRYDWLHWDHPNWPVATMNTGALAIAIAYILTPRKLRYDADSPTAPLAALNMTSFDQIATLVAGLMFVVPHLFLAWEQGRTWVMGKIRAIRLNDITAAVTTAANGILSSCMESMMSLLKGLSGLRKWLRECVISLARVLGIYRKDRSAAIELALHTSRDWHDSM